ncbi:MAG: sulfate ABC transporter permease subunit CysW [Candidatus Methylacidiphilales bacterium]|nr:sulfate ABC transporter permease subunit CysW [Candidatus Methylacidiphilales bacterium]
MAHAVLPSLGTATPRRRSPLKATTEPLWFRALLIVTGLTFIALFLLVPLFVVFYEALAKGVEVYWKSFQDPDTAHAIRLTLTVAAIVVPLNTIFGLTAAWAISKFEFPGKRALVTFIDLPLWVSPIVAGLMFVILFGREGLLKAYLWNGTQPVIPILFNTPGIVIATLFVTFPFVARILIPLMQSQGSAEEEAALTLGARGWQVFLYVTLPKIRWGLFYGVILCNARAMGEFGAVSAVSGHIQGKTNTMPLHIQVLAEGYSGMEAAFALSSVLSMLALFTLIVKTTVEWSSERQAKNALESSGE